MYKIINDLYDSKTTVEITCAPYTCTRGNSFKLFARHSRYDLRKHFFINRVTNIWNSLPNKVTSAPNINAFKSRIDRFWGHRYFVEVPLGILRKKKVRKLTAEARVNCGSELCGSWSRDRLSRWIQSLI